MKTKNMKLWCADHKRNETEAQHKPPHTPTPWKVADPIHDSKEGYIWKVAVFSDNAESGDKLPVEALGSTRQRAQDNAAFIVKAVNNHDALLTALKCLVNGYEPYSGCNMERAKQVIAKAEGR